MKRKAMILMAYILAMLIFTVPAHALTTAPQSAHSASAAYAGDTTVRAWIATNYDSNARAVVNYINATSDLAGSFVRVYWYSESSGGRTTVDAASSGTTVYVGDTTGFSAYDLIVIQNSSGKVIEREVASISSGDYLVIDAALATGFGGVGNYVVKMADGWDDYDARIAVGAATITPSNAEGVIKGPRNSPIMMVLDGTSASRFDAATWDLID